MTFDRHARGVYVIAATPFTDDGAPDEGSTDRMVDFYLSTGVTGMTILGIMGEAPKMAPDEGMAFARRVLDRVAGRVPVVVGVSGPGLDNMARLTGAVSSGPPAKLGMQLTCAAGQPWAITQSTMSRVLPTRWSQPR